MYINERYSKRIVEPFAKKTIGLSFDNKYLNYCTPQETDNFDFVSEDGQYSLEVTIVFSKNERSAYEYEVQKSKGKKNLDPLKIKGIVLKANGDIQSYYGGSIKELQARIIDAINIKQEKALKKSSKFSFNGVDLCVCIVDGGLLDVTSFEAIIKDIPETVFLHIFFITSSLFICFENGEISVFQKKVE